MKRSERRLGGEQEGPGEFEGTVRQSRRAAGEDVSDKCCIWKRSREQRSLSSEGNNNHGNYILQHKAELHSG